jgi:hypothetical protein
MKRLLLLLPLIALAGAACGPSSSPASNPVVGTYQGADVWGDSAPASDMGPWAVYYDHSGPLGAPRLTLDLRTAGASSTVGVYWEVDTNGDRIPDFVVFEGNNYAGNPEVFAWATSTGQNTCDATPVSVGDHFTAVLDPVACFGGTGPLKLRPETADFGPTFFYDFGIWSPSLFIA